jgi:hypothetical protein
MKEITIEEATAIIMKTDPRHKSFYGNDPATVAAVEAAFARQDSGTTDLANGSTTFQEIMNEVSPAQERVLFSTLLGK